MIERITSGEEIIAIILSPEFDKPGVHFFTPPEFSQQLAYMRRPEGEEVEPHYHHPLMRNVQFTQEVLFIRRGKVRADFYDSRQNYLGSRVLGPGEVVLLAAGGHGFTMLEESEIIEVKQGPYMGVNEKQRFPGVRPDQVRAREEETVLDPGQ